MSTIIIIIINIVVVINMIIICLDAGGEDALSQIGVYENEDDWNKEEVLLKLHIYSLCFL